MFSVQFGDTIPTMPPVPATSTVAFAATIRETGIIANRSAARIRKPREKTFETFRAPLTMM